jgi:Fe-S cluster assembly iron-binding protein IscA
MLQITEAAENAIRMLRAGSELPDSTALRIATIPGDEGGVDIAFAFTEGPDEGDLTVSEKEDFRVYLAPDLAEPFENAALEATADEEGIELMLRTEADLHENGSNVRQGS